MFKKLAKMISEIKTERDRWDAWTEIDRVFDQGHISWEDHEILYDLASMVEVEE